MKLVFALFVLVAGYRAFANGYVCQNSRGQRAAAVLDLHQSYAIYINDPIICASVRVDCPFAKQASRGAGSSIVANGGFGGARMVFTPSPDGATLALMKFSDGAPPVPLTKPWVFGAKDCAIYQ